ncbi:MAG TPA: lipopolysaccharide heptosyltransferase II [Burkholderiales bacterium]|nr:lipopolysaccharide heptosyltransferase II [Burkholderiales bacterium]
MTKILVVAPSWVGDALLSQPLLALLKRRDPACTIDVLGPGWALPIFRRMPEVGETLESPFAHGELALRARMRLGRQLRSRGYDCAYVLPNSLKSALAAFFARIPRRIGFVGEARYGLLTDARRLDEKALPLMVERFAALATPRGEPVAGPPPRPQLTVQAHERQALLAKLRLATPAKLTCLCPGAEYGPAKRWPPRYFGELAAALAAQGHAVWVVGSARERDIGEAVRGHSGGAALNLCGRTTLDEAVVLLSCAQVVVTNDSGLMHVAAALDRPMVALYGSSSPAFTPPLSARARIVKLDVACSPCFERECPLGHFDCMMKLAPQRLLDEIRRLPDIAAEPTP